MVMKPALGLDIGTSTIVTARLDESGAVVHNVHRDAFFEMKPVSDVNYKNIKKSLDERKFDYIVRDGSIYVIGASAIRLANERHKEARRPLHRGVISAKEKEALPMIKHIIQSIVGPPIVPGEVCYYSVPGQPVDSDELNVSYHEQIFNMFLQQLGYTPHSLNEAEAIVYAELIDSGLTGLALSFGAGMVNVCLCSMGEPVLSFALSRSGDYIDRETAIALDLTASIVQAEKEATNEDGTSVLDLGTKEFPNKIHEALTIHYGVLLKYVLNQIVYEISNTKNLPVFTEPIPIVVAGGTSIPRGFIELFKSTLAGVKFPLEISEVRHCTDCLKTVSRGALYAATL